MQQCPNCGRIYDESESARCPYCGGDRWKKPYTYIKPFRMKEYSKRRKQK